MPDRIQVIDVPGDGSCWVYAFCTSLKINCNFHIEPQHGRIKQSEFVQSMRNVSGRLLHSTAFQLLQTSLRNTEIEDMISGLSAILKNNNIFEILSLLIRTGHLNKCLWAGSFDIERNIISTVFETTIIISTDIEVLSMKSEDIN